MPDKLTDYQRGLLRGFLLAHNAPREMLDAIPSCTQPLVLARLESPDDVSHDDKEPIIGSLQPDKPIVGTIEMIEPPVKQARASGAEIERRVAMLRAMNGEKTMAQAAAELGVTIQVVQYLCGKHRIPLRRAPRGGGGSRGATLRQRTIALQQAESLAAAADATTYTDEQGRTVTKCPTRHAWGSGGGATVKPRSGT